MASLIDIILELWASNEDSTDSTIEKLKIKKAAIEDKIKKVGQMLDNGDSEVEKSKVINDFLDMIGSDKRVSSGYTQEVKRILNSNVEKDNDALETINSHIKKYSAYSRIMNNINGGIHKNNINGGIHKKVDDRENPTYISDYEFYCDVYLLNGYAKKFYEESYNQEYNYEKYKKSLSVFTIENMKKVGHPINDKALTNGVGEMVCAICRMSWEIQYAIDVYERQKSLTSPWGIKNKIFLNEEKRKGMLLEWFTDYGKLGYECPEELKKTDIYNGYLKAIEILFENRPYSLSDIHTFVRKDIYRKIF